MISLQALFLVVLLVACMMAVHGYNRFDNHHGGFDHGHHDHGHHDFHHGFDHGHGWGR